MAKEITTFYKKVGTKFEPISVNDPEYDQSMGLGFWLVHVKENSKFTKREVHPNLIEALAAFDIARDAMTSAMVKGSAYGPEGRVITEREQKAWAELKAAMGSDACRLTAPSIQEVFDIGRTELIKHLYVSEGPIQEKINRALKAMEEPNGKSISKEKKVTKTHAHNTRVTNSVVSDTVLPVRKRKRNNSRITPGPLTKMRLRKS